MSRMPDMMRSDGQLTSQLRSKMPDMMRSDQKMVSQPRVKMPDGRIVRYPSHAKMLELAPRDAMGAVEGTSTIRARTWQDSARDVSEYVAKVLGIDLDQMADLKARGIMLGMVPLAPSGIGKKFIDSGVSRVVSPNDVKPRRGMFHSFFGDEGGNLHDLGDLTHDVALVKSGGMNPLPQPGAKYDQFGKLLKNLDDDVVLEQGMHEMPIALEKHKLMRLQVAPNDIALELHHQPTPHQIDALSQLVEKNPKAKFSYDMFNGEANEFKNSVTGKELMDKLIEFYYSGKTNNQLLRETVDKKLGKKLEGSLQFSEPGEWKP